MVIEEIEKKEGNALITKFLGYVNTSIEFEKDWNQLMDVFDEINGMGKEYNFSIFKTYIALSVKKGGRVYKDFSFAHSEYITNTQTSKEAMFRLIVKFIKWYNSNQ